MPGDEERSSRGNAVENIRVGVQCGESSDKSGSPVGRNALRCSVCEVDAVKYTCPGCGRKSCSLPCVQEHKTRFFCTGKRNRTEFVKRGAMSDVTLRSDFKFLEEVSLAEDVAKRSKPPTPRRVLPSHLKSLVHQARLRGVNLKLVSPGMQKRKLNSSRYDYKSKRLMWRVVWKISGLAGNENAVSEHASEGNGECSNENKVIECIDARVDDGSIVATILEPHIKQTVKGNDDDDDVQSKQADDTVVPQVAVVLRKEGTPADKPEYYRINTASSLKDVLAGKTVIEYPEFICIPSEHLDQYLICV